MMRILQLTKKFPWPLNDGELIAISTLAAGLKANQVNMDLLAMNTSKHFYDGPVPEALNGIYDHINTVFIDNRPKILEGLINLFSAESYHIARFIAQSYQDALKKQLKEHTYDAVLLETIYLAPYIPLIKELQPTARIVLRAHNIEHQIWERLAANSESPLKKLYLQLQIPRLKKFEIKSLQNIDLLCPISQLDAAQFRNLGYLGPCTVVETGLDLQQYNYKPPRFTPPVNCAFIGSLDWPPNQEGLTWLAKEVWPEILKQYPDASFHIAGKNAPPGFGIDFPKGFHFYGKVEDATQFIQQHPIFIVPLLSGSGIRIKILEAMALGRVVLSTSIGAEGIAQNSENALLICDNARAFVDSMSYCYNFPEEMAAKSSASRGTVQANFEYRTQASRLLHALA